MQSRTTIHHAAFLLLLFLLPMLLSGGSVAAQNDGAKLISQYIAAWREFYPSAAFAYGDVAAAEAFEDYSESRTANWLSLNKTTADDLQALLGSAEPGAGIDTERRIDLQVLLGQAEDELENWREDRPLTHQPQWYAEQISQAMTHLLVRDQLSGRDRSAALRARLKGVQQLCRTGMQNLIGGNALRTQTALRTLEGTRAFYAGNLRRLTASWPEASDLEKAIAQSVSAINALEEHLRTEIMPTAPLTAAMDADNYAAKLSRRTSGLFTPEKLSVAAGAEMAAVRGLMILQAKRWHQSRPASAASAGPDAQILATAIAAMEADRKENSADFLKSFSDLTFAAQRFVEDQQIASIPKPTTLLIELSPAHFSGAAVGGVYPAGPFAPEAETLFYVPSIPDSAAPAAREGFYRSFNTHFNTMIMSHEMFPGHYLQYKVAVTQAAPLRSLFANGAYVEGWGSFAEELMLDAGWADDAPLTRLAHLRKRLENATRAYVSVQVNTSGWGESKVLAFARDEGLLAPQFAKNLWQRVVNSPLQITDYFSGYQQFRRLFTTYQKSPQYDGPRDWVDAVLRAGPIPPVMLSAVP